jgi:hypothetical protein
MSNTTSPGIDNIRWGRIQIAGQVFKDAKVFPGGAREWDWSETGTHHIPGIQPADVQELIDNGAKIVILSRGMLMALQVHPDTHKMLKEKNIPVYILETSRAAEKYNNLCKTDRVGGLFHSTC